MAVVAEAISTRSEAVQSETRIGVLEADRHRLVQQTKAIQEFIEARISEHPMREYSLLERDQDALKIDRMQRDIARLEGEIKTLREGTNSFEVENLQDDYIRAIAVMEEARHDALRVTQRAVVLVNQFIKALGPIYRLEATHQGAADTASRLRIELEKRGFDVSTLPTFPLVPLSAHDLLKRLREGISQPQHYRPLTEGEYPSLKVLPSDELDKG